MENIITQVFANNTEISIWIFIAIFIGGVISSLSPCTIGIIPVVIGCIVGSSEKNTKKTFFQIFFFVLGLSAVLTILGIIAAFTGKTLGFHSNPFYGLILASLIMVMGLVLLEIIEIPIPVVIKQLPQNKNNNIILFPFILGGAFSLASTPCSTPILAGIMAYSSLKSNIIAGGIMLFLYALGQSTIIFIAGLFASFFKKMLLLRNYSAPINKFSGIILIFASLLIYLKIFAII